jgi:hypothetical protein
MERGGGALLQVFAEKGGDDERELGLRGGFGEPVVFAGEGEELVGNVEFGEAAVEVRGVG